MRLLVENFRTLIYYLTIFQPCIPLKANNVVEHTGLLYTKNVGRVFSCKTVIANVKESPV